jgi:hypothetical protein
VLAPNENRPGDLAGDAGGVVVVKVVGLVGVVVAAADVAAVVVGVVVAAADVAAVVVIVVAAVVAEVDVDKGVLRRILISMVCLF